MGKDLKGKELGEGLTQKKDKKYLARFTSITGKRCSKVFESLLDAKKWMVEAQHSDFNNKLGMSNNIDVSQWFDFWITQVKGSTVRNGTKTVYTNRFKAHIQPVIGNMLITNVKPVHCQAVLNHACNANESDHSVKKLRSLLASLFKSAVENGMIAVSPVVSSVKAVGREPDEKRILTLQEQELFLKEAKKESYYNDFVFILETGLRVGELMGLRWSDVDFKSETITVNRTIVFEKGGHVEHQPKTKAGRRKIPLTKTAVAILQDQKKKLAGAPVPMNGTVFTNGKGQPVYKHIYNRALKRIADRMGIDGLSMHCLRHTFATRCIESGMKPKTLQKILGHANISMTMDLYVHVTEDELKSEILKLERRIV